jgi:type IV secretion system protein VirD4
MIVQSAMPKPLPAGDDEEGDADNGGIRREPELPDHEEIVPPPRVVNEFEFEEPMIEEDLAQSQRQSDRMRTVARQTALDPGDGIEL